MHPDDVEQDSNVVLLFDRSVDTYEEVVQWLEGKSKRIVDNAHKRLSTFGEGHSTNDTVFVHYYYDGCIGCCPTKDAETLFNSYKVYNVTLGCDIMQLYLKEVMND